MIEQIRVSKIEIKPAKNNTTLYTIIGTDGSKQSQFSDNVDLSSIMEGAAYEFGIFGMRRSAYHLLVRQHEIRIR